VAGFPLCACWGYRVDLGTDLGPRSDSWLGNELIDRCCCRCVARHSFRRIFLQKHNQEVPSREEVHIRSVRTRGLERARTRLTRCH